MAQNGNVVRRGGLATRPCSVKFAPACHSLVTQQFEFLYFITLKRVARAEEPQLQ